MAKLTELARQKPEFRLPEGLLGRFAVIKLWPGIKAAEDENLARLRRTAASLGLECVVVDFKGRLIDNPKVQMTKEDVDFVIHLHFETPKCYDMFSFVALWNPLQFYFEWGYRRFSRHLLSHDDFLSCSSPGADDHVRRMIAGDPYHAPPELKLYHSLSEPLYKPSLGDRKLFYAGINWERLGKGKSRHQDVLNLLDSTGHLRIYGPRFFHGEQVWEGFESYVGPVPFDGVSMVREIANAGISLVFSSEAHKQSGLMSNRLFESIAAGAVVIADENPFVRRHFGDSVLTVDSTLSAEDVVSEILAHKKWIDSNPEKAIRLAESAQSIFLEKFALERNLIDLYEAFPARRDYVNGLAAYNGPAVTTDIYLLMPEFSDDALDRHNVSIKGQQFAGARFTLAVERSEFRDVETRVRRSLAGVDSPVTVVPVEFYTSNSRGEDRRRRKLGAVLHELLNSSTADLVSFVAPNEVLISDHYARLVAAIASQPSQGGAASDILLCHKDQDREYVDSSDELDLSEWTVARPLGLARFLFRRDRLPRCVGATLPYTNALAAHALVASREFACSRRPTVMIDIQDPWWVAFETADVAKEWDVLFDVAPPPRLKPVADRVRTAPDTLKPRELSLALLPEESRAKLFDQLWEASAKSLEPSELTFRSLTAANRADLAFELYSAASPVGTYASAAELQQLFSRLPERTRQQLAANLVGSMTGSELVQLLADKLGSSDPQMINALVANLLQNLPYREKAQVARNLFGFVPLWDILFRPFQTLARLVKRAGS